MGRKSSGGELSNDLSLPIQNRGAKLVERGKVGTFCIFCGVFFDSVVETRKHHFAEHYRYCLEQCGRDIELLHDWMTWKEPEEGK